MKSELIAKVMSEIDWSQYEFAGASGYVRNRIPKHLVYFKHKKEDIEITLYKSDQDIVSIQIYDFGVIF